MAARKRELIEPHRGDKRFVRRGKNGQFTNDQVNAGRSINRDNNQHSGRTVGSGQGDRGDQRRRS